MRDTIDGINEKAWERAMNKPDKQQHYIEALGILRAVRNLRRTRATLIQSAIEVHGWQGPLISGCEQDHWPAKIKDYLRTNAREISKGIDDAMTAVRSFGYVYSHSTSITALDGSRYIHHTYKHGEHNVGLSEHTPDIWDTSTSCASGRRWVGKGHAELLAHLKSKSRRYGLKRG